MLCGLTIFLLFSSRLEQMFCMAQELADALGTGKLSWKPGSLSVMANDAALRDLDITSCEGFTVHDTHGNPILVPRTSEMPVLGILLDQQGGIPAASGYRLTAANAHFWSRKNQLTCKRISLRARFLRLYTIVRNGSPAFGSRRLATNGRVSLQTGDF